MTRARLDIRRTKRSTLRNLKVSPAFDTAVAAACLCSLLASSTLFESCIAGSLTLTLAHPLPLALNAEFPFCVSISLSLSLSLSHPVHREDSRGLRRRQATGEARRRCRFARPVLATRRERARAAGRAVAGAPLHSRFSILIRGGRTRPAAGAREYARTCHVTRGVTQVVRAAALLARRWTRGNETLSAAEGERDTRKKERGGERERERGEEK